MTTLTSLLQAPALPARLTADGVARLLGFSEHDIPILVSSKLLRPLGNPARNAPKFFATVDIQAFSTDAAWLAKATRAISEHWKRKNHRKLAALRGSKFASNSAIER
jgi:hypothetical protein